MKLNPINPSHPLLDAAPLSVMEAGCLIGSACDADLPLPPADDLGRIQAVIRLQNGRYSLETLSAKGCVQVNGRNVNARQSVELLSGDRLQINQHSWSLEAASSPGPLACDAGDTAVGETVDGPETKDVFEGLLGGPGVVPVGAPVPPLPDGSDTHILSDTRPTLLNHQDPEMMQRRDDIGEILDIRQDRP